MSISYPEQYLQAGQHDHLEPVALSFIPNPNQTPSLPDDAAKGFEETRQYLKSAKQKVDTLQDKINQPPYPSGIDLIED